jgi:bis(5'-nucleosidyl)-tetraphosphatase
MTRTKRLSAGIVIVRQTDAGIRYLLLRAYNYWDFPKGEAQRDETPLQAARREVREETTLKDLEFCWGHDYYETPPYAGGKVARYYLARTRQQTMTLPVNPELGRAEHHQYRWLDYDRASALLVPRVRAVLDWAQHRIGGPQPE